MTHKIGFLKNEKDGTYHPVFFYPSAKPSEYSDELIRHYSYAHLYEGFASMDEAIQWADKYTDEDLGTKMTKQIFIWDGESRVSIIHYFER